MRSAADSGASRPRDVTPKVCPAGKVLPLQHSYINFKLVQPAGQSPYSRRHAGGTGWVIPPVDQSITAEHTQLMPRPDVRNDATLPRALPDAVVPYACTQMRQASMASSLGAALQASSKHLVAQRRVRGWPTTRSWCSATRVPGFSVGVPALLRAVALPRPMLALRASCTGCGLLGATGMLSKRHVISLHRARHTSNAFAVMPKRAYIIYAHYCIAGNVYFPAQQDSVSSRRGAAPGCWKWCSNTYTRTGSTT